MKKPLAWLLALVLAVFCGLGTAEGDGLRHQVTGDVSAFEVDETAGMDQTEPDGATGARIGTDAYLYVEPNSASYVTFYVTDENGKPIQGAQIYISYKGAEELYGVTDANGLLSLYLFRNSEYGYRVGKVGYESAEGRFTPGEETRRIHVVLRRPHELTIVVVDDGVPVPDVVAIIEGERYTTNERGCVTVQKFNGIYSVVIRTPDGRRIYVKATVDGDTTLVVDIGKDDDSLVTSGRYSDRFLVYNKRYEPEDYVMSEYVFSAGDLTRDEGESQAAFDERVKHYLAENPDTLLIEAQPERIQHENRPDEDILTREGEALYAQRSLMPTGFVLKAWEERGYERLVFTNEDSAMAFELPAFHSGEMMKMWTFLYALADGQMGIADAAAEETTVLDNPLKVAGLSESNMNEISLRNVDLDAIRAFEFAFDHRAEQAGHETCALLPDELFTDAMFEFRITPIQPEALCEMISGGLGTASVNAQDEILLANAGYSQEILRRLEADGRLTDTECAELYWLSVDGRLNAEEIQRLQEMQKNGELGADAVQALLDAVQAGKAYRMQVFVYYGEVSVNITALTEMTVLCDANDFVAQEYDLQAELTQERGETATHEELTNRAQDALLNKVEALRVDNEGRKVSDAAYQPGENTLRLPCVLVNAQMDLKGEFYETLLSKQFRQWNVDVRLETYQSQAPMYQAYVGVEMTRLPDTASYRLKTQSNLSGLYLTVWTELEPCTQK